MDESTDKAGLEAREEPESLTGDNPAPPPQLSPDEITAERARGRKASYFALAAGVLILASQLVRILGIGDDFFGNSAQRLASIDSKPAAYILFAATGAIGVGLTVPLLLHLIHSARMRAPNVPSFGMTLAVGGPAMFVLALPLLTIAQITVAGDFSAETVRTVKAADEALRGDALFVISAGMFLAGSIGFGLALVLASTYAMRTGLLTRFQGIIGVVVGFLSGLQSPLAGVLQIFWLGAVATTLLSAAERMPSAWAGGKSMPRSRMRTPREPVDSRDNSD